MEVASCGGGDHAQLDQPRVSEPPGRLGVERRQDPVDPLGVLPRPFQRLAAEAGPVPGGTGVGGGGEEFPVLPLGRLGRAGRAAEYAGGPDPHQEQSFVGRAPGIHRPVELFRALETDPGSLGAGLGHRSNHGTEGRESPAGLSSGNAHTIPSILCVVASLRLCAFPPETACAWYPSTGSSSSPVSWCPSFPPSSSPAGPAVAPRSSSPPVARRPGGWSECPWWPPPSAPTPRTW